MEVVGGGATCTGGSGTSFIGAFVMIALVSDVYVFKRAGKELNICREPSRYEISMKKDQLQHTKKKKLPTQEKFAKQMDFGYNVRVSDVQSLRNWFWKVCCSKKRNQRMRK